MHGPCPATLASNEMDRGDSEIVSKCMCGMWGLYVLSWERHQDAAAVSPEASLSMAWRTQIVD